MNDKTMPSHDQAFSTPDEHQYASILYRIAAFVIDILLLSILITSIDTWLNHFSDLLAISIRIGLCVSYFTIAAIVWRGSTIGKALLSIAVHFTNSKNIVWWQLLLLALLRTLLLFATLYTVLAIARPFYSVVDIILLVLGFVLLAFPLFDKQQRMAHDILCRSIVIETRQRKSSTKPVSPVKTTWRKHARIVANIVIIAVILFMLYTANSVYQQRNLLGRVYYALEHSRVLQDRVVDYVTEHNSLPSSADLPASDIVVSFPDGGGAMISTKATIVIWFSIIEQLKQGKFVLVPKITGNETVSWQCNVTSTAMFTFAPHHCRTLHAE